MFRLRQCDDWQEKRCEKLAHGRRSGTYQRFATELLLDGSATC
jgi:hypothetical protein